MDIFQINELSNDTMNLSHDKFYDFLETVLNKDLSELFRLQAIRDISSLTSITVDQIIEILNYDVVELNPIKKALGFITIDGKFHLRLGYRNLLERLISLVKAKEKSYVKTYESTSDDFGNNMLVKLTEMWKQRSNLSHNTMNVPILIPWMKNIFENFKKEKNRFSYDNHIQQFALLLLILGGRNCYEFLRLNLPASLPHISNVELLMRNNEQKITECEFRFERIKEYARSNNCNYVFSSEDSTSSVCHIDYDAQLDCFIGFSSPLINGLPNQTSSGRTILSS